MNDTSGHSPRNGESRSRSPKAVTADQARIVRRYLSAIESGRPGRGSKRATDAIGSRISKVDELLVSADPLTRLHLTQERIELHAEQVRLNNGSHHPLAQLEREFTRVVRSYSDRNGITFAAWRQCGVDAKVLDQVGIHKAEKKPPPAVVRAAAEASADQSGAKPPHDEVDAAPDVETSSETAPSSNGTGLEPTAPDAPPATEVSLEELASLLTSVGSGAASTVSDEASQPTLGEELSEPGEGAGPRSSRQPRPVAEE